MAAQYEDFIQRFPEFVEQSDPVITAALEEAARTMSASVWAERFNDGQLYLAAHIVASRVMQIGSAIGMETTQMMPMDLESTMYGKAYLRLINTLPICGFVV
jgi:hypothetical protein